jgi:hypothetical protein
LAVWATTLRRKASSILLDVISAKPPLDHTPQENKLLSLGIKEGKTTNETLD